MNLPDRFSLAGKVALVTGGAGLYGRQIFEALAEAGAEVVIASRDLGRLREAAAGMPRVTAMRLDLASEDSIRDLIRDLTARFGRIDILVNNAVTRSACGSWDQPMDSFDASLRANASALFRLTYLAAEEMKRRREGSIINIGSYMGTLGLNYGNYAGTGMYPEGVLPSPAYFYEKGGMVNFTRFAASVLGPYGIRVNCLNAGGFQTPDHDEAFVRNYSANTMLGRLADGEDLKGPVVFLASQASKYITGANIPVDGGYSAK